MKSEKKEIFLTKEGLAELQAELDDLKQNVRPEVISQIKEARAQGDLSENAEYHAARDRQGQVEARIKELEYLIDNATIIEDKKSNTVQVGSTVEIKYIDDGEIETYYIVGSTEADPSNGKISDESPVGSALLGKKVGDVVEIPAPAGSIELKVVEINK